MNDEKKINTLRPLQGAGRKLFVETYGCQMNVGDTEIVVAIMQQEGYVYTDKIEEADIILINTCSIRDNAEQRIWGRLREMAHLRRRRPGVLVGIIGCMAERLRERLLEGENPVDIVAGPDAYRDLPRLVREAGEGGRGVNVLLSREETYAEIAPVRLDRNGVSGYIAIMRGCNNYCSYCVVPYTRGVERSRDPQTILNEARSLFENGYREVTLLGQNVNSYGKDRGEEEGFSKLLELVDAIPGVERIRYMTSHPRDMSEAVVRTIAESQHICKNFHIPVQSGSSRIMKAMNRGYDRERYLKLVETIRRCVPDAVITTDLIVGFPGETEKDFEETLDLLRTVEYDDAFTFIYSPRKGTPAAGFGAQVPDAVKHERLDRLMALQNEICLKRNKRLVGRTLAVMVEGPSKSNPAMLSGRTDGNDLVLWPKIRDHAPGELVNVKMERAQTWLIRGKEEA